MQCYSCRIHLKLNDEVHYYKLSEIGSELSSVVVRNLNREIDINSIWCKECFTTAESIKNQLPLESRVVSEGQCGWCLKPVVKCHTHPLPNWPERDDIAHRTLPQLIQPANKVCYAHWIVARRKVQRANKLKLIKMEPSADQHFNSSTVLADTVKMEPLRLLEHLSSQLKPQTSEPDPLISQPEPLISQLEPPTSEPNPLISQPEPSISQPQPSTSQLQDKSYDPKCVWCQTSLARKHTHSLPEGPEREYIAQRISPRLIKPLSRVCYACWWSAQRKSQIIVKEEPEAATNDENVSLTTLHNFRRTGNTERACFVHGCNNIERHVVPDILRYRILKYNKLYVTENARICSQHLGVSDWGFLNDYGYINQFTPSQLEAVISLALTNQYK